MTPVSHDRASLCHGARADVASTRRFAPGDQQPRARLGADRHRLPHVTNTGPRRLEPAVGDASGRATAARMPERLAWVCKRFDYRARPHERGAAGATPSPATERKVMP